MLCSIQLNPASLKVHLSTTPLPPALTFCTSTFFHVLNSPSRKVTSLEFVLKVAVEEGKLRCILFRSEGTLGMQRSEDQNNWERFFWFCYCISEHWPKIISMCCSSSNNSRHFKFPPGCGKKDSWSSFSVQITMTIVESIFLFTDFMKETETVFNFSLLMSFVLRRF